MYTEHPAFFLPDDRTRLWRYMSVGKFADLLQTRHLYFGRADNLGDQFEGGLPTPNLNREGWDNDLYQRSIQQALLRQQQVTLVNCWHANRSESDALWQVYGGKEAVAIRTTVGRLKDSLRVCPHPVYIGMVHYIDYESTLISKDFERFSFMFKRNSFEHEREVRAVVRTLSPPPEPGLGRGAEVDVDALIEQVYVAPTAQDWFMATVARLTERYGVPRAVLRNLPRPPLS